MTDNIRIPQYQNYVMPAGTGTATSYNTGFNTTVEASKVEDLGTQVSKIVTNHGKGFWSVIRICDDDFIYFKLFRGRFGKLVYQAIGIEPRDSWKAPKSEWECIPNQGQKGYKLEAELGKTYLAIDELIVEELKEEEHRKFIKGIASTDPENLKMIAGLKKLDEGMTEPLEPPAPQGKKANNTAQYLPPNLIKKFNKELCKKEDELKKFKSQQIGKAP